MTLTTLNRLVAAIAVLGLLAVPGIAMAQESDAGPIERIKAEADEAITQRLATLMELSEIVTSSEHLTSTHATTLTNQMVATTQDLSDLNSAIQQADSVEQLAGLVPLIATDHRVYLVVVPKVFQVIGADTMAAVTDQLVAAESELEALIARVSEAGLDTTRVQTLFDAAILSRIEAERLHAEVADQVILLQASDWPEPAKASLESGAQSLADSYRSAREAAGGYRDTVRALRELTTG